MKRAGKKGTKNAAAVELALLRAASLSPERRSEIASEGGKVGGKARADSLSAKRRSAIAKKAAQARWDKKK